MRTKEGDLSDTAKESEYKLHGNFHTRVRGLHSKDDMQFSKKMSLFITALLILSFYFNLTAN